MGDVADYYRDVQAEMEEAEMVEEHSRIHFPAGDYVIISAAELDRLKARAAQIVREPPDPDILARGDAHWASTNEGLIHPRDMSEMHVYNALAKSIRERPVLAALLREIDLRGGLAQLRKMF